MSTDQIVSQLWKAAALVRDSSDFPRLVEAAAWKQGKEYSDRMLRAVAADSALLDALVLERQGDGVGAVLAQMATDTAVDLDGLITAAVAAYQEPGEVAGD